MIDISIILATHNRPDYLDRALASICMQQNVSMEVIVVDDASAADKRAAIASIVDRYDDRFRLVLLGDEGCGGHGPSQARNRGAQEARSDLIAFLDDDDEWIRDDHLVTAVTAFKQDAALSYYCANQVGVTPSGVQQVATWLPGLQAKADAADTVLYRFTTADLLLGDIGFPHLNTTVLRRSAFQAAGGFDISLRYCEDLELNRRMMDQLGYGLYRAKVVARHYIPDGRKTSNASTRLKAQEKRHTVSRLNLKLATAATTTAVRVRCMRDASDEFKHMSAEAARSGDKAAARYLARAAFALNPGIKWLFVTLALHIGVPVFKAAGGGKE